MVIAKVIRGKGLFAKPTGEYEKSEQWGMIPIVEAVKTIPPDCIGVFTLDFPRVISVPRYRIVRTHGKFPA